MRDKYLNQIVDEVQIKSHYHGRPASNMVNKVNSYIEELNLSGINLYLTKLHNSTVNEIPSSDWVDGLSVIQVMLLKLYPYDSVGIKIEGSYNSNQLLECMQYVKNILHERYIPS